MEVLKLRSRVDKNAQRVRCDDGAMAKARVRTMASTSDGKGEAFTKTGIGEGVKLDSQTRIQN